MLTTNPYDDDKLREECGVFGVSATDGAAALVALGLHALQHRGQEAAGITTFDGAHFHTHRAMGHVAGNFDRDDVIRALPGTVVRGPFAREIPRKPSSFISRCVVQRATGRSPQPVTPSRPSWAWTLRMP